MTLTSLHEARQRMNTRQTYERGDVATLHALQDALTDFQDQVEAFAALVSNEHAVAAVKEVRHLADSLVSDALDEVRVALSDMGEQG